MDSSLRSVRILALVHTRAHRIVILALVVYEYLITLDSEVATVWKRRLTASSVLLLSVRCNMVANVVLNAALTLPKVRAPVNTSVVDL